eukprot:TRINITY_DN10546_c0_g1_i17.p1 TRINITY_DN10546_c0_g1~~TRINITY_DN10546_c0_g1_i17.p1  ORF type:complete len:199 (+),score=66.21 TRINITY_DN10546_c0_g1_i17:1141-1737(+)
MEKKDPSKSVAKNIHGKEYQCDSSHSSLSSKKLKKTGSIVGPKLSKNSNSSEKGGLVKQREKLPNQRNEELKKPAQSTSNTEQGGSKKPREKLPYRINEELKKPDAVQASDGRNIELKKPEAMQVSDERNEELKKREAVQASDGRSDDLKKLEAVKVGDGTASDGNMHEGDAKNKSNADEEAKPTKTSDFDLNVFPPN